ncbi:M48 family metallopeptidase [Hymenobacter sp. ASUV-10]|uniref:M48 family metallopeptidase n=1 Tax=Hymenobacter aranciens TaxID=3063996 RepID=A0ABT9BEL1_9BACT|nr:M48 family metallopeptidase [Hymenobacter sp. ASUV-10]MDO7876708.1 M48 family metallopeptidase [Hymenobacter sp. ASUV-10]
MRLLFVLLLGTGSVFRAAAQAPDYLPYYSKDTLRVAQLAATQRAAVKTYFALPKEGNSAYRDHYRQVVQEAARDVYNSIRYSALLDPVIEPFVQQVFARILKANPQLPAGTRLVLTRNPEPNAHAVGNGIVMLNVGLLPRLENESQLAFILCHELAHVACHHMENGLHEHLTTLHSKDMKREIRRIIDSEYNISSQIKALALGFSLNTNYHRRRHEKQADSLGYVLLARTTYDAPQAYRALQLLDTIDEPETTASLPLASYFSCADFPKTFAPVPDKPTSIFTVQKTATALETTDTLKSHPDCAKRMRFLHTLAQGRVAEGPQPASSPEFARIRYVSRLEVIQSWFDYDCYDHALFEALLLLPQQPGNAYLHSVVQLSLYELRQHLQDHTYSEVVSNKSTRNPKNFNELIHVLHGLSYDDFRGLSTCFAQATGAAPAAPADEYALAARYASTSLTSEATAAVVLKEQYQKQYSGGKFDKLLFPAPAKAVRR